MVISFAELNNLPLLQAASGHELTLFEQGLCVCRWSAWRARKLRISEMECADTVAAERSRTTLCAHCLP